MKFTFVTMIDRTFPAAERMAQNTWIYATRREAILNLPRELFDYESEHSRNYWCEWDEVDEPGVSSYVIGPDGMLSFTIKTVELQQWKIDDNPEKFVTNINQGEPEYDVREMGKPALPPRLDPHRVLPGDEQFKVANTWGIRQGLR